MKIKKILIFIVLIMTLHIMTSCSNPENELIDYVPLDNIAIDAQINNDPEKEMEQFFVIQNEKELQLLINDIDFQRGPNFLNNINNLVENNYFHDNILIVLVYTVVGAPLILAEENEGNIIFHIVNTEQYDSVTQTYTLFFSLEKNIIDNISVKYSFELNKVDSQTLIKLKEKYK